MLSVNGKCHKCIFLTLQSRNPFYASNGLSHEPGPEAAKMAISRLKVHNSKSDFKMPDCRWCNTSLYQHNLPKLACELQVSANLMAASELESSVHVNPFMVASNSYSSCIIKHSSGRLVYAILLCFVPHIQNCPMCILNCIAINQSRKVPWPNRKDAIKWVSSPRHTTLG